jgi:hypothetical protein
VPLLQVVRPVQEEPPRGVKPHRLARAPRELLELLAKALLLGEQQVKPGQVLRLVRREVLVVPISQSSR